MSSFAARFLRAYVVAACAFLMLPALAAPFGKELANVRNWQSAVHVVFLVTAVWKRRQLAGLWGLAVPSRHKGALLAAGLVSFTACVVMHYRAFLVNGIDFSTFDWMLYNTNHGRFMWSPVCECTHFGVHTNWFFFALLPVHALFSTPLFFVVLHGVILWSAAVPLWRLAARTTRSDVIALLATVAWLTNAWTGTIINHAFHPEALFVPAAFWLLVGWTERKTGIWVLAAAVFLAVREDAGLYLAAFAVGALLFERDRRRPAAALLLAATVLFLVTTKVVQPTILARDGTAAPGYFEFWAKYGATPGAALRGMLAQPVTVLRDLATSGLPEILVAAGLLPLLFPQAMIALAPAALLLGTSANPHMHSYNTYYPAPLLPFLFWGIVQARVPKGVLAGVLFLTMPLVGGDYMKFPLPDAEAEAALQRVVDAGRPAGRVCAQPILIPHLPYGWDVHVFDEACFADPQATSILSTRLSAWPWTDEQIAGFVARAPLDRTSKGGAGLVLVAAKIRN